MMKRSRNSSIKLIIAIIVIAIILGVGVKYVVNFINKEKVKNFQADLLLIKAKIEVYKGNYDMNKGENPLPGYQLNQLPENININQFLEKNIISEEEYEKYYLLDAGNLESLGLQELSNKYSGFFIVNYDSFEVVYTGGYENENGIWCYKLSDLKKLQVNQNQQESEDEHRIEESNEEE